jgi:hypothetical protein
MRGVRERDRKLVAALTFPPAPPSAHPQGEKGGTSEAGAISRTRSPLSRSAGEGPGVRASRSAGEGPGVRASRSAGEEGGIIPPDLPPSPPFRSSTGRERGDERSRSDLTNQITPLPQRGRGAGGEGLPQRGRGAGGEGLPQRGRGAGGEGLPQRGRGRGNYSA